MFGQVGLYRRPQRAPGLEFTLADGNKASVTETWTNVLEITITDAEDKILNTIPLSVERCQRYDGLHRFANDHIYVCELFAHGDDFILYAENLGLVFFDNNAAISAQIHIQFYDRYDHKSLIQLDNGNIAFLNRNTNNVTIYHHTGLFLNTFPVGNFERLTPLINNNFIASASSGSIGIYDSEDCALIGTLSNELEINCTNPIKILNKDGEIFLTCLSDITLNCTFCISIWNVQDPRNPFRVDPIYFQMTGYEDDLFGLHQHISDEYKSVLERNGYLPIPSFEDRQYCLK